MIRSALAIVAGFVLTIVLAVGADAVFMAAAPQLVSPKGDPAKPVVLAVALAYTSLAAVAGAYATAAIARRSPILHALVLGSIALIQSLAITVASWGTMPAWYQITSLVVILPACCVGGWLRTRLSRLKRTNGPSGE